MAMCLSYDEDLTDNQFFQTLRKEYTDLFYKAILEGCLVCVPRAGTFSSYVSLDDVLGHILLPNEELPESHFNTLSGKEVKVYNRVVTVIWDSECQTSSQILFEETYYTEDYFKYKVVCLEHPLEPKSDRSGVLSIATLRDCIDFLNDTGGRSFTEQFDAAIAEFLENKNALENSSMQTLKELTYDLYNKCFQDVLADRTMREKAANPHNLKNLRLAIETYIHHGIYKHLFKLICSCTAEEDGNLNRIIRNCGELQSKDLEIRAEFYELIPKAKTEISKLNGYGTVMGKLGCLRKMMAVLSKDPESGGMLAADDLLPIIIIILLKVQITNWFAHLNYMKHFRFSSHGCGQDEDEFMVTTLEAALEHIDSGVFLPAACADSIVVPDDTPSKNLTNKALLFEYTAKGDLDNLKKVLESDCEDVTSLALCHPLCVCEKCQRVVESNTPSVESTDESGMTALHIAAMYGKPVSLDYLISQNADVDCVDNAGRTPLHHAAIRGHQSCLLFLIQFGADANAADNGLNTPLHLCAAYGHLTCVKALIYHCEQEGTKLLMNAQNNEGDTPLHNACRYGYLQIVQLLVAYDADPSITNRRKLSSYQMANNLKITEMLTHSRPKFKCALNVKAINFDFLEEGLDKGRIIGELPLSAEMVKKVEKMLRAITHGDVNLACFYLGLGPISSATQCHPLCSCQKCNGDPKGPLHPLKDKVGINMCDTEGHTALHLAAQNGFLELTQLLVKNGALVNVQTRKFTTPLILACQQQRTQIAEFLLQSGCSVNLQDSRGNTALHYVCASLHCNRRLVEILVQYKPKLSLKNKSGRTALQEAETRMSIGVMHLLKQTEFQ